MPRKSRKTQKPPLLFLEKSLDGARVQNEPEVRAAIHPKSFITARPTHENTSHRPTSWVSPQFEPSHLTTPPARRGRRKGHSTTSVLDRSTQLSRKLCLKTSICKFPTLSFERGPTQLPDQTRGTKSKKKSVAAPASTNRRQPSRAASLPSQQTPKKRTRETPDVSTSSSSVGSERPQSPPPGRPAASCESPGPLTAAMSPPRAATVETPGADSCIISSPPDVDTPAEGSRDPSPRVNPVAGTPLLGSQPPETLVADTPEQDYGLRVTWRRRKGLMMALEKGGLLSKVDTLVPMR